MIHPKSTVCDFFLFLFVFSSSFFILDGYVTVRYKTRRGDNQLYIYFLTLFYSLSLMVLYYYWRVAHFILFYSEH